jgi:hypothetical protein
VATGEAAAGDVGLMADISAQAAATALSETAQAEATGGDQPGGAAFTVMTTYPAVSLVAAAAQTLQEAKLLNSAVVVELT